MRCLMSASQRTGCMSYMSLYLFSLWCSVLHTVGSIICYCHIELFIWWLCPGLGMWHFSSGLLVGLPAHLSVSDSSSKLPPKSFSYILIEMDIYCLRIKSQPLIFKTLYHLVLGYSSIPFLGLILHKECGLVMLDHGPQMVNNQVFV